MTNLPYCKTLQLLTSVLYSQAILAQNFKNEFPESFTIMISNLLNLPWTDVMLAIQTGGNLFTEQAGMASTAAPACSDFT